MQLGDDALWNGEDGAGGISWVDRSRMGPLRGVIDAADDCGRRNAYMHLLHTKTLERELRRLEPVGRALDFGCGTGRMLKTLASHSTAVYGIDREPTMVEAARSYAGAFARHIETWQSDRLPFQAEFFDFVLCSSVLCVTSVRLFDRSLAEIARILRPGATVLLLEQIAPARGLTLRKYFDALCRAGFETRRAYAIRSARSPFTQYVAKYPWIPGWAFGAMAGVELAISKQRKHTARADPYVEYAIVAQRP
jgi:SAM-dependent methyltransferase